jgi:hypothetical protein
MDFEFYNEIGRGSVLTPARRGLRRLLRPTFYRLRDLIRLLFDRQQEDRAQLDALRAELADLRARHAALAAEHSELAAVHAAVMAELREDCARLRPVATEAAGVSRRIAVLEDALLRSMADRAAA